MAVVHLREFMNGGDVAIVDCAQSCRVMLMSDANFSRYQRGKRYFCREEIHLPVSLEAPAAGFWNIVLELAAEPAAVRHSIQIVHN